ncbi:HTH_48 domain-containing protein [Trichonephila clavipes]|nr:HTH_48 domain-containing protein [Trichonephila clavipes]
MCQGLSDEFHLLQVTVVFSRSGVEIIYREHSNIGECQEAEFKRGRKSLGNDERLGRPNTTTTRENIAEVHQIVLDDRRIKVRAYYASLLDKLKAELAEKQLHLQQKKIMFHQDALPSHSQWLTWQKSTNYGSNCLTIRLTLQI